MKSEDIFVEETVECISDKLKQASRGITPRRGRDRTRSLERYTPTKLELMNNKTGIIETLTLKREAVNMFGADVDSLTED